jgi:cytochrome c-type biogenesis protein CcmH/NrfG
MLERKWLYGIVGVAAVAVLATAGGLYLKASSQAESAPVASMPPPGAMGGASQGAPATPGSAPSLDVMADRLAQRLKSKDGTADEWALLARSYVQIMRYPEAVDAYGKAIQKSPGDKTLVEEQAAARKSAEGVAPPK